MSKNKFDIIQSTVDKFDPSIVPTTGRFDPFNRNRLSWWFPRLPSSICVPKTEIIIWPQTNENNLLNLLDGKTPDDFQSLCERISQIGDRLGWPMFLRTDYLSGKHNWKNTCYVPGSECVAKRVTHLVEESAMADIMGFPTDCWIARKLIPTKAAFTAFYGDMPIVKERRYFVQDAQVVCHHPYWPMDAFLLGDLACEVPNWKELLAEMNVEDMAEVSLLSELSSKVGAAIGGAWSIDWLWSEDERKWYLTDMADAAQSYHWSGCRRELDE